MQRSRLSLKWLEVFQLAARSGSLQAVAAETGLSISTVSHHLRALNESLGVDLLDHSKRPMVLTAAGEGFLRHIEEALRHIRAAELEAMSGDLVKAQNLTLGMVDDFEAEITPELASILAARMQNAKFGLYIRPSHEIIAMLRKRQLFAGVVSRPADTVTDLIEYPLLRDPFVVVVPSRADVTPEDCLDGRSGLPMLRYSQSQFIGRQIEAQLRRLRISLPNRFEFDSTQSILALIAEGRGWTITTPANVLRARRFQPRVSAHRFPHKGFARYVSLFTTEDFSADMAQMIAGTLRRLIRARVITPALEQMPWLDGALHLLPEAENSV